MMKSIPLQTYFSASYFLLIPELVKYQLPFNYLSLVSYTFHVLVIDQFLG